MDRFLVLCWASVVLLVLVCSCGSSVVPATQDKNGRVSVRAALKIIQNDMLGDAAKQFGPKAFQSGYVTGFIKKEEDKETTIRVFHDKKNLKKAKTDEIMYEQSGAYLPSMPEFRVSCKECLMVIGASSKAAQNLVDAIWKAGKSTVHAPDGSVIFYWKLKKDGYVLTIQHKKMKTGQELFFTARKK